MPTINEKHLDYALSKLAQVHGIHFAIYRLRFRGEARDHLILADTRAPAPIAQRAINDKDRDASECPLELFKSAVLDMIAEVTRK